MPEVQNTAPQDSSSVSQIKHFHPLLSGRQAQLIKAVEVLNRLGNVSISINEKNAVVISAAAPETQEAISRTFDDIFALFAERKDVSQSKVQALFRSRQRETDPKSIARQLAKAKTAAPVATQPEIPVTHVMETIGANELPKLGRLILALGNQARLTKALEQFKAVHVDNIKAEGGSLKVLFPVYEKEATTYKVREAVIEALDGVSRNVDTKKFKSLPYEGVKEHVHSAQAKISGRAPKDIKTSSQLSDKERAQGVVYTLTELNKQPILKWAEEIDKSGRKLSLQAFAESPDFDFSVSLFRESRHATALNIRFNKANVKDTEIKLAIYALEEFQKISAALPSFPNKAETTKILKKIWEDINKKSEAVHGDFLKMAFEQKAWVPAAAAAATSMPDMQGDFELATEYSKPAGRFGRPVRVPSLTMESGLKIGVGDAIFPTANQWKFLSAMRLRDVVVTHGPAGSGKTMFAAYEALKGLADGRYEKVCLTSPAVEAGEQLGFMPGDKDKKMHDHVVQILEHMEDIIGNGNLQEGKDKLKQLMTMGVIEIAPHAFNRGRNYKNTFYIIDENQNALWKQIITAATRINHGSTFVFMGDDKQNDRTFGRSAYSYFVEKMSKPEYARFVEVIKFDQSDIKRHDFIKLLIEEGDDQPPPELNERQTPRYGQNQNGPSARDVAMSAPAPAPQPGP